MVQLMAGEKHLALAVAFNLVQGAIRPLQQPGFIRNTIAQIQGVGHPDRAV